MSSDVNINEQTQLYITALISHCLLPQPSAPLYVYKCAFLCACACACERESSPLRENNPIKCQLFSFTTVNDSNINGSCALFFSLHVSVFLSFLHTHTHTHTYTQLHACVQQSEQQMCQTCSVINIKTSAFHLMLKQNIINNY